jgi:hypothetical protein
VQQILIASRTFDVPRWKLSFILGGFTYLLMFPLHYALPVWGPILGLLVLTAITYSIERARSVARRTPKIAFGSEPKDNSSMSPFQQECYKHNWLEERAAILEFESGYPREEAEAAAIEQWHNEVHSL